MKLQSFSTLDAVLRGGSFAAAAAEAHLTPGAVSLQMKQLEAWLGQSMFDRSGLAVRPVPPGPRRGRDHARRPRCARRAA